MCSAQYGLSYLFGEIMALPILRTKCYMCKVPLNCKVLKSCNLYFGPLSEIILSGTVRLAKMAFSLRMTVDDVEWSLSSSKNLL